MNISNGWRSMNAGDIGAVKSISDQAHGSLTEDAEVYAERLALYPAGCFVLERDDQIRGYLITHPWMAAEPPALNRPLRAIPVEADCYYLHDLALSADMRGGGEGSAAVRLAVDAARKAGQGDVLLMAVNGADAFWKRQGFSDISGMIDDGKRASYGPGSLFMRLTVEGFDKLSPNGDCVAENGRKQPSRDQGLQMA